MKKVIIIALAALALVGCEEKYVARVTDVRLVSVEPRNGYPGDIVTVFGNNFSPDPAADEVTVGGVPAIVIEAASGRLQIVLPEREPGQWPIAVKAPAGEAEGIMVNYLKVPDHTYLVSTIVGQQGQRKCEDGVGVEALTYMPTGINKAPDGTMWFTDRGGNKIRRIAKDMTVQTLAEVSTAGSAVWQGCFDAEGNYWYNDKAKGNLYCLSADGSKNVQKASGLDNPMNVAIGSDGYIYVPCRNAKVVYKFDPATMAKSEFATIPDDGPAFIAFDHSGNMIVSVQHGYRLLSIAPDGNQSVIFGTGEKSDKMYDDPDGDPLKTTMRSCQGLDIAPDGTMYICDVSYNCVRKLTPDKNGNYAKGKVETVLGGTKGFSDGKGLNAKFNEPDGILIYDNETLYICDAQNCLIRKVNIK